MCSRAQLHRETSTSNARGYDRDTECTEAMSARKYTVAVMSAHGNLWHVRHHGRASGFALKSETGGFRIESWQETSRSSLCFSTSEERSVWKAVGPAAAVVA
mmetsp:Transcript_9781/g.29424  ORF Transcript_9781/g.29424 Transcript_9781/m.29424 type:complete len:102 (+) Transcript_9781:153-458(+)